MIRSLEQLGSRPYDLCIVGAGAAGISLALALRGKGLRIALLESGGHGYEREVQDDFEGEALGAATLSLREMRLAGLGGSTGVWAGFCRPLDPADFGPRPGFAESGWPFGRDALEPFYRRAHEVCGLSDFDYQAERWERQLGAPRLAPEADGLATRVFQVRAQHFGERYRAELEAAEDIDFALHATVLRLELDPARRRVELVEAAAPGGARLALRARAFVLAAGGIENPRLLLASAESPERAPGNRGDRLGRYYGDHPFVDFGSLLLDAPHAMRLYQPQPLSPEPDAPLLRGALSLSDASFERASLPGAAALVHPRYEGHPAFATPAVRALLRAWDRRRGRAVPGGALADLGQALRDPVAVATALGRKLWVVDGPAREWRLRAMFECEPRAGNRVSLASDTDRFGRRRARVEWQLGEGDLEGMRRFARELDAALRRAGVGRLRLAFEDAPEAWLGAVEAGKHALCTTRMHPDPERGVVDAEARVHGVENLYAAGSSVFASPGYANPTLTLVALTLRLADHLAAILRAPR